MSVVGAQPRIKTFNSNPPETVDVPSIFVGYLHLPQDRLDEVLVDSIPRYLQQSVVDGVDRDLDVVDEYFLKPDGQVRGLQRGVHPAVADDAPRDVRVDERLGDEGRGPVEQCQGEDAEAKVFVDLPVVLERVADGEGAVVEVRVAFVRRTGDDLRKKCSL